MAKAPAFQFYVRDWLCSRKVTSMSGEAVKAYMYLLCESWLNIPRATLPSEDIELAEMARVPITVWMRVKSEVLRCFETGTCDDHKGLFYNERLLEVSRNYEKNQRPNNKNARRTRSKRDTNAKKRTSSSSSSSSSTSTATKDKKNVYIVGEHLAEIWPDFEEMRAKAKKPLTDRARKGIVEKLKTISPDHEVQAKILEQSIINSWADVFPLRGDSSEKYRGAKELAAGNNEYLSNKYKDV